MILALVASGLTLIFGIMDVVNFAHGDLVMLGGFVGAATIATTGSFWLALLVAALTIGVFGAVLQATTLRPLLGRDPLTTILATFGLSLVLQKYAIWQWGPSARQIPEPLTGRFAALLPASTPGTASWRRRCPAAIILGLWLFLKHGKFGDLDPGDHAGPRDGGRHGHPGAARPHRRCSPSAPAMAAASGVLFGPLGGVTQTMGFDFTLRAFIVVVVGGMGNLGGSILAAMFISLVEAYAAIVVSPAQAVIVSFVVLVLTMLFRPTGLFVPTPK